jgi:hypothetical protein
VPEVISNAADQRKAEGSNGDGETLLSLRFLVRVTHAWCQGREEALGGGQGIRFGNAGQIKELSC